MRVEINLGVAVFVCWLLLEVFLYIRDWRNRYREKLREEQRRKEAKEYYTFGELIDDE